MNATSRGGLTANFVWVNCVRIHPVESCARIQMMCDWGLTHMEVFPNSQDGGGDLCTTHNTLPQILGTSAHAVGFLSSSSESSTDLFCVDRREVVMNTHFDLGTLTLCFALVSPENGLRLLPQSVHHRLKTVQEFGLITV